MFALLLALQATSNCTWTAGGWSCHERAPVDYGATLNAGRNMVPQYQAPTREEQQAIMAQRRHAAAGRLIAAGKCDEAEAMALNAGDLTLAQQVKDYCSK